MAVGDRTQLGGTAYDRLRILTTCRTIAMVGLSANPYHPSDFAAIYLAANGYNIIPINPSQAGVNASMLALKKSTARSI
jgi:uncharacterized protein